MENHVPTQADDVPVDMHDLITATPPSLTVVRPSPFSTSPRLQRIRQRHSRPTPRAEKDIDELAGSSEDARWSSSRLLSTSRAVHKLFAPGSPSPSRPSSYLHRPYLRSFNSEAMSLPVHLYTQGLLTGRHSDITVRVFGKQYALHRIILDRTSFFATALSGPWVEASSREITLHPEDIDFNITQAAFDVALKRLYGCPDPMEEEHLAVELLAVGCWLEMPELVEIATEYVLKNLRSTNVADIINVVTTSFYGRAGERIFAAARTLLLRDGWYLPLQVWDEVPSDVIQDIVSADDFFVCTEWDRWVFAKTLLDRRLRMFAIDADLIDSASTKIPRSLRISETAIRRSPSPETSQEASDSKNLAWVKLYEDEQIRPLLALLDQGIYYAHFPFEQLSAIREARDVLGVPVMPDRLITDALWMGQELKLKVQSAAPKTKELGVSADRDQTSLRAHAIPQVDRAVSGSPIATDVLAVTNPNRESDGTAPLDPITESDKQPAISSPPALVSKFPPFRFGAVFPNERALKEKKKVFSQPLFYAGNWWRMYVKRDRSKRTGNSELGIYIHRADKCKSDGEDVASVDEMIGALEEGLRVSGGRTYVRRQTDELPLPRDVPVRAQPVRPLFGMTKSASSTKADDTVQATQSDSDSDMQTSPPDHLVPRPIVSTDKPYDDKRPLAKAYFKFYSHTRYELTTSIFESAPDFFDFAHSKGWKLEDIYASNAWLPPDGDYEDGDGKMAAVDEQSTGDKHVDPSSDGKMRFIAIVGVV